MRRLGLETARIPQRDRHGTVWLGRGALTVEAGTLRFITAGTTSLPAGEYDVPFQSINCIVLEPGTTVSHDVMRLLARHGTGLVAAGTDGVRLYASMPFGPDDSRRARKQARLWASETDRRLTARRMYAMRLGELFPDLNIEQLRGMEGIRARRMYERMAQRFGVEWAGRQFDRDDPSATNAINTAINHASSAVVASAHVATAIVGAIPQLGFIHEDSGKSFVLDIADLFRDEVTLVCAFSATAQHQKRGGDLERLVRTTTGKALREGGIVARMIDRIKELLDDDDDGGHE